MTKVSKFYCSKCFCMCEEYTLAPLPKVGWYAIICKSCIKEGGL